MDGMVDETTPATPGVDVQLLDRLCNACLSTDTAERETAERMLLEFQGLDDTWLKIPAILAETTNPQTRFFALQVLERLVKYRWASIGKNERTNVRNFVAGTIGANAANKATLDANRAYVRKLNGLLVEILQLDWPQEWPDFIDNLLLSSHSDPAQCENNFVILRMLSEAMHDFWETNLSMTRSQVLRGQLAGEFDKIFPLVNTILGSVTQVGPGSDLSLLEAAVDAFAQFLGWIDTVFIYDTAISEPLLHCMRFPELAVSAMTSLAVIASLFTTDEYQHEAKEENCIALCYNIMTEIEAMVGSTDGPVEPAYTAWREKVGDPEVNALLVLLINISNQLFYAEWKKHQRFLERTNEFLLRMSLVEDDATLKTCFLCHWIRMLEMVADRAMFITQPGDLVVISRLTYLGGELAPGEGSMELQEAVEKRTWMKPLFEGLLNVAYERMVAPAEDQAVYVGDEFEAGFVPREFLADSESRELQAAIREALIYISHITFVDTMASLQSRLREISGPPLPRDKLDRLCWCIGALAGRLLPSSRHPTVLANIVYVDCELQLVPLDDNAWFVESVTGLLGLVERCPDVDDKRFLNMHATLLLSRYPRFLDAHRQYIELAVGKIFGLLHEPDPIPQKYINVATDTFEMLSYFNRNALCEQGADPNAPLPIERIIADQMQYIYKRFANNTPLLATLFGSMGAAIRPLWWSDHGRQLLASLCEFMNRQFSTEMAQIPGPLKDIASYQLITKTLRLNMAIATTLKGGYAPQMEFMQSALVPLYEHASLWINDALATGGTATTGHVIVRTLRRLRRNVLNLATAHGAGISIDAAVSEKDAIPTFHPHLRDFATGTLPALITVALTDFVTSVPEVREVQVCDCIDQGVNNLGGVMPIEFLQSTVNAIVGSMVSYVDSDTYHLYSEIRRSQYFILGFACSTRLFLIENQPREVQERLLKVALYGMKVFNRDVGKNALVMTYHFFASFHPAVAEPTTFEKSRTPPRSDSFLAFGVEPILNSVWEIMTDSEHKNTFENQAPVIARIFDILAESPRQVLDPAKYEPGESNKGWLQRWFVGSLIRAFPQLSEDLDTCQDLFQQLWDMPRRTTADEDRLGNVLRDFLLDLGQFRKADNSALFTKREDSEQEREEALRQRIPSLALDSKRVSRIVYGSFAPDEQP